MGVVVKSDVSVVVEDAVTLELGTELGEVLDKLQSVKMARKALDDMEAGLKSTLMSALPPRDVRRTILTVDGVARASLVQSTRNGTSADMLKRDYADVYAATLVQTPVESLKMI